MNQTTELKEAIEEASKSLAICTHPDETDYYNDGVLSALNNLEKQLAIVKDIVLPAQLILFFDDERGFDYVEQDTAQYIP
jgi:hypothetical protein